VALALSGATGSTTILNSKLPLASSEATTAYHVHPNRKRTYFRRVNLGVMGGADSLSAVPTNGVVGRA